MQTRILFLDDSGKPDANHVSGAVVIGGFAIDADQFPSFSRRLLGAKGKFFPLRGLPQAWEVKSGDIVKPNPWKRSKNRAFVEEAARLVRVSGGTMFSAAIIKKNMHHAVTLSTTMPLQLQALVEHFDAECRTLNRTGMLVADWSSHHGTSTPADAWPASPRPAASRSTLASTTPARTRTKEPRLLISSPAFAGGSARATRTSTQRTCGTPPSRELRARG